jgi:hypothetical protein
LNLINEVGWRFFLAAHKFASAGQGGHPCYSPMS